MTPTPKRTGRPSKKPADQTFRDKAIYALLIANLPAPYVRVEPTLDESVLDTLLIAKDIGVTRYTVYRFLNDEKLSKKLASELVRISGGKIAHEDVLPFLMRL